MKEKVLRFGKVVKAVILFILIAVLGVLSIKAQGNHGYVDLGLPSGLLWATCDVGANAPEEYGNTFAWGETHSKSVYNWRNYKYCHGGSGWNTLTKYCTDTDYGYNGFIDNLRTLLPNDDVATVNWSNGWRMPTEQEWQELCNNTSQTRITQNGVYGMLFTASNGNSLFLPGNSILYWSSSLHMAFSYYSLCFDTTSGGLGFLTRYRYNGCRVRAVHAPLQSFNINTISNPYEGGTVSGGGVYAYGSSCTLVATANEGYTFVNWTEGVNEVSTDLEYTFTVTGSRALSANFSLNSYDITASTNIAEGGIVTGGGVYAYGSSCTLVATANEGYTFVNWTEGVNEVSTDLEYTFTVTGSRALSANFSLNSYDITASTNIAEGGIVTGGGVYAYGSSCTLVATANEGYTFVNWTEDGNEVSTDAEYTFTVTEDRALSANFNFNCYEITALANNAEGSAVSGGGVYAYGSSCTLVATANQGYTFVNWTEDGNEVSTDPEYTFTVTGERTLTANFSLNSYEITASANIAEGGVVTGGGVYTYGSNCTLMATANEGYTFVNWTENDEVVSTDVTYSFEVTGDRDLVANFNQVNQGNQNPIGSINGKFTVNSDGSQVYFSQGNLQYIGSASTPYWKFAEYQWDYLGTTQDGEDQNIDRDLFGWGTSGYNHGAVCYQPWSTSMTDSDYLPYYDSSYDLSDQTGMADWGYNPISNGGNQPNQWRTLSIDEWAYVFNTRSTPSGIRYAAAKVNGVNGVILLPDDWSSSYYILSNTNNGEASFSSNIISVLQWNSLEQHGAVFLSTAGKRWWQDVDWLGSVGQYWSATHSDNLYEEYCEYAYYVHISDSEFGTGEDYRRTGASVRLVCSAENYSFGINATPNPVEGGTVSGGGNYLEGSYCTLTATASEGYTFVNWTENGYEVSTDAEYTFTVTGDRALTANFSLNSYEITVSVYPSDAGTVSGAGVYVEGDTCTLTATAYTGYWDGYSFINWTKNGVEVSSETEYSFIVTENAAFVANFEEEVYYFETDECGYTVNEDKTTVTLTECWVGYGCDEYVSCPDFGFEIPATVSYQEHTYTVTAIGNDVFKYRSNLVSITIPNTVKTIMSEAFYECTGLQTITIPSSVTAISNDAFAYCSGLKSIIVLATTPPSGSGFYYGVSQDIAVLVPSGALESYCNSYYWRRFSDIREDQIINFADENVKALCVENWDADGDGEIYLSESYTVTTFSSEFSYENITSFDELQYFMGLSSIEVCAFEGCANLTSIIIPKSVDTIKHRAFFNCSGLMSITVLSENPPILEENDDDESPFYGVDMTIPCHVPCGSYNAYQSADYWSDFTNMIEGYRNISVSAYPAGSGIVSDSGYSCDGMSITVTATANEGYTFENWTENGEIVAITASYSFTVDKSINLVANFSDASGTGRLNGVFSVSENSQVNFSTGNLQYQASTGTWRFATNQFDYVGYKFYNTITQTYDGWVDLFCWGTSGYNHGAVCYQPWSTSYEPTDYLAYGDYTYSLGDQTGQADWGYNAIINGGNQEGQWRTLTNDEWNYILTERNTESSILFAKAIVNGVNGLIILPDNWNSAYYTLYGANDGVANYDANVISASDWAEQLEVHGAAFLPAAGYYSNFYYDNTYGCYWSATPYFSQYSYWLEVNAYCMYFNNDRTVFDNANVRDGKNSVRLVQAVQPSVTQQINLTSGCNWVSFNVEITLDDLKAALVAASPNAAITIKSQTQKATYNPSNGRWTGRLTTFDLSQMYKITVSTACEITLEGVRINPAEHPVTITPGANWIAYPLNTSKTPQEVFTGFAVPGDMVKSQSQKKQYNSNGRWSGQLGSLEPGKGYIYTSSATEDRVFTFPMSTE